MSTREQLVEATRLVLRRDGLAKLSTRLVAREAGVSEGALYKHFATKEELVMAAIRSMITPYMAVTYELPTKVGLGRVEDALAEVVWRNFEFSVKRRRSGARYTPTHSCTGATSS